DQRAGRFACRIGAPAGAPAESCHDLGSTLGITPCHDANSWSAEKSITLPRDGSYESGSLPVVFELQTQVPHVAIDDVASCGVILSPQSVQDLVPSQRLAGIGREQVQECLLHRGQYRPARSDLDLSIKEIDLQSRDFDDGDERDIVS